MDNVKFILRLVALPIIAIPIIILGWLTATMFGLTIVGALLGVVLLPIAWIVDSEKDVEHCREIIGLAAVGVAYPFVLLFYFLCNTNKFKEMIWDL